MSKLKALLLVSLFSASILVPTKKANAGLVFMGLNLPAAELYSDFILGGVLAATGTGLILADEKIIGLVFLVVDETTDGVEETLASAIPGAPQFIRAQIAQEMIKVAKNLKPNRRGFKLATLPTAKAKSILEQMNYVDKDIQDKTYRVMTDKLEI